MPVSAACNLVLVQNKNNAMNNMIADLLKPLSQARKIVIFSGAGLSADSGIPTFRDGATGLWANSNPEDVVSIGGFEEDPDKVWAWHEAMRALFAAMRPNAGHEGIATLEWLLPNARVTVITQNIDGLHQAAGSARVFEIHGSTLRIRCHHHCGFVDAWQAGQSAARRCPSCGAPTRPDVVWFGEPLNKDQFSLVVKTTLEADIFFSVGTSASVHPAASLPILAKENGALVVEINPHKTPFSGQAAYSIRVGASVFFSALSGALGGGLSKPSWREIVSPQRLMARISGQR